jgi:hypothetical protein
MPTRPCPCTRCNSKPSAWEHPWTIKRHLENHRFHALTAQAPVQPPAPNSQHSPIPPSPLSSNAPGSPGSSKGGLHLSGQVLSSSGLGSDFEFASDFELASDYEPNTHSGHEDNSSFAGGEEWDRDLIFEQEGSEHREDRFSLDDFEPISTSSSRSPSPSPPHASSCLDILSSGGSDTESDVYESDDDVQDISHDPAFIPRSQLFPFSEDGEEVAKDLIPELVSCPAAFSEHPIVQ